MRSSEKRKGRGAMSSKKLDEKEMRRGKEEKRTGRSKCSKKKRESGL